MMRHRFARLFAQSFLVSFLAVSVFCGCKAYRDPALAPAGNEPFAVLIHHAFGDDVLLNIDGNASRTLSSRFELKPGTHSILLEPNQGLYIGGDKLKIDFEARAGETYYAKSDVKIFGGTWSAWIVEASTGKRFDGKRVQPTK
jgi:hypothetical protein